MKRETWARVAAGMGAAAVVVAALVVSRDSFAHAQWRHIAAEASTMGYLFVYDSVTPLLLAGSLIGWRRQTAVATVVATLGLLFALVSVYAAYGRIGVAYSVNGAFWVRQLAQVSNLLILMALGLLQGQRLMGKLDRLRVAGAIVLAVGYGLHIAARGINFGVWGEAGLAAGTWLSFLLFAYLAWCLAFRQAIAPHRPTLDAA